MKIMCCSLAFVLLYSEFIELATINRYKTVSIRVSQIEPDPYIYIYSQTCVQRPPLGPKKSSRLTEVSDKNEI